MADPDGFAGISNPEGAVYVRGDEFTDGSVRVTMGANDQAQVQRRTSGVWSLTELETAETAIMTNDLSTVFNNAREILRIERG